MNRLQAEQIDEAALDAYNELRLHDIEPALTFQRFAETVSAELEALCQSVPDEPQPQRVTTSVATQCPCHGSYVLVTLRGVPFPVRISANADGSCHRCILQAFYPYTLRAVHDRYFGRHGHLPPGGAFRAYEPHPGDFWPGPLHARVA